ncbi:SDR family oxidoreductase [Ochrobactrum sp. Q0168]|nr:SDR family oxidoreductase [Ochrobactrum sp. Q0168]
MGASMRKAIVLGGYGLIGRACMRALANSNFEVVGVGRSRHAALAADADGTWLIRDIPTISVDEWQVLLDNVDVIVNAAGALQDGARDGLEAIHVTTVARLVEATKDISLRIVQISAAGVGTEASTEFFRSKARGDEILARSGRDCVILRPTLVLSPDAYGGTALLRGVAGLPLILPRVLPHAQVQTVHIDDVAMAVVAAATGKLPSGLIADLTEPEARSFSEFVDGIRQWQGFSPPWLRPKMPALVLKLVGKGADLLGWLGWRSPMRSTALQALAGGIQGDPSVWLEAGGYPCRSLVSTLRSLPSTRQERLFARMYFMLPLAIATLALFWCVSGLFALISPMRSMAILEGHHVPAWLAGITVYGGAFADIALGLAILWRSATRLAAVGMIVLSACYLFGGLAVAPDLWLDPLGPMVKVVPSIALAAIIVMMQEAR